MPGMTAAQEEAKRTPQVQEHLDITEREIGALKLAVDNLEERLSSILVVEPPSVPPPGKEPRAQMVLTPTANRLRDIHTDISYISSRLNDIRGRVEA